eukprot:Sdes_comp10036_c0_seq1m1632
MKWKNSLGADLHARILIDVQFECRKNFIENMKICRDFYPHQICQDAPTKYRKFFFETFAKYLNRTFQSPQISNHSLTRKRYFSTTSSTIRLQECQKYKANIGVEIHAQILANKKIFSPSSAKFNKLPNSTVSWFDAALPGTLPILNERCVEAGILTALALNCRVNLASRFDRKHYFYGDMPAGYQITQQRIPLAENGSVLVESWGVPEKERIQPFSVKITRIHLEQDSGKTVHDQAAGNLIDLNRAGCGLLEIVSEPDLKSPEQVSLFIETIRRILVSIGTNDGSIETGSMRVDVNVSVSRADSMKLGQRVEIKNISGFRFVHQAIDYEIKRQTNLYKDGNVVVYETRGFNPSLKKTFSLRKKEAEQDYRYMNEPDLPSLRLKE